MQCLALPIDSCAHSPLLKWQEATNTWQIHPFYIHFNGGGGRGGGGHDLNTDFGRFYFIIKIHEFKPAVYV